MIAKKSAKKCEHGKLRAFVLLIKPAAPVCPQCHGCSHYHAITCTLDKA